MTTYLKIIAKDALVPWAAAQERELVMRTLADVLKAVGPGELEGVPDAVRKALPVRKAAEREMEKAADIGKEIHAILEMTMRGRLGLPTEVLTGTRTALDAANRLITLLDAHGFEPQETERFVWSAQFNFAGTTDIIANIIPPGQSGHVFAIGDYKSGKAIYPESVLQLAAYRRAYMDEVSRSAMWGFIARASKDPDKEPQLVFFTPEQLDEAFRAFCDARDLSDGMAYVRELVKPPRKRKEKKAA